jgi:hypothetical protein
MQVISLEPSTQQHGDFWDGQAKSRAHALNRRISYTVDWDATDVNLEGQAAILMGMDQYLQDGAPQL